MVDSQIVKTSVNKRRERQLITWYCILSEIIATRVRALVKLLHPGVVIGGVVQGPSVRGDSTFGGHHVSFMAVRRVCVSILGVVRSGGKAQR